MKGMAFGLAVALVTVAAIQADATEDSVVVKGKLKDADLDKGILTVTVGGEDREFQVNDDTKFLDKDGEPTIFDIKTPTLPDLFRVLTLSTNVPPLMITSKMRDGKDVAISVRLPIINMERKKQKERAFRDNLLGKPLPTFKMTDTRGQVVTNADLNGKVVLIDFWATWCGPCLEVSPIMQGLHERYAEEGLTVIGASVETGEDDKTIKEKLDKYREDNRYDYMLTSDAAALAEACGISGIPTMLILDRKGIIREVQAGLWDREDLRSKLDKAVKLLLDDQ